MKNKIFLWVLLGLSVSFGFWLWSFRLSLPVDEVIPQGAIFYADLAHVENHIKGMAESDLGKSIASIDLPEVMGRNHFPAHDIHDIVRWQKYVMDIWGNPLTRKFFSRQIAVCILKKENRYEIFGALRLTVMTKIAESVARLFHAWPDGVSVTSKSYHGLLINRLVFKKRPLPFSYVRLGDLLITSPEGYGQLEDVVDTYQHRRPSLADDSRFVFVKINAYPKADALVFINMDIVSDLLRQMMDVSLERYGYKGPGIAVLGVSYLPGEVSKYKVIASLNERTLENMQKTFSCRSVAQDSLKLVPVTAIAYHWSGCYDFEEFWQSLDKKMQAKTKWGQVFSEIKEKLEKRLGVNIQSEVLPVLGHEAGGYLTDIDMQGKYPFPRLLLFVKIKDHLRAQQVLYKLESLVEFHSEGYRGVKIKYVTLGLGGNMDPGYGFMNDYLLVATSRQLLKLSIDAYSNALHSFVSDDVVKQFSLDRATPFHSVTLMKTAEVAKRAVDVLGWVNKSLSSQVFSIAAYTKEDGAHKQLELDQAIADKNEELLLAQKKLAQLKSKTMSDVTDMDAQLIMGAIANLRREESAIDQDIETYKEQKEQLHKDLDLYAARAQTEKLTMFNMENILSPVLKGLESIDAQAVTVRFNKKIWETEILVK